MLFLYTAGQTFESEINVVVAIYKVSSIIIHDTFTVPWPAIEIPSQQCYVFGFKCLCESLCAPTGVSDVITDSLLHTVVSQCAHKEVLCEQHKNVSYRQKLRGTWNYQLRKTEGSLRPSEDICGVWGQCGSFKVRQTSVNVNKITSL